MESPRSLFAVSTWSGRRRHDPKRAFPGSWDRRRRPKANHTAARSCDWTAVSADWLPLRLSASLPSPFTPTPSPKLQANEKALYRRPPFAFSFFPPRRGRRHSDWPDVLGSPLPLTNHQGRYTPSGVLGQLQSGHGAQACCFTSESGFHRQLFKRFREGQRL